MLPAFDQQWNNDLQNVWGVTAASFQFLNKGQAPEAGSWWLVFLDNSDDPRALACHDVTTEGLPLSKILVKTILADKASVSVGATHEMCEMAVDPWLNSGYQDPDGVFWAGEICDPMEDDQYGYLIDGTLVTDFITPDWFAYKNAKDVIDFKGHTDTPFQVLTGQRQTSQSEPEVEPSRGLTWRTARSTTSTLAGGGGKVRPGAR